MNSEEFLRHDKSALLITPREQFLEIVRSHAKTQDMDLEEIYFPEEDSVILVPHISKFPDYDAFIDFIESIKPKLLARELGRFGIPYPAEKITAHEFESLFSLGIRDEVYHSNME